MVQVLVNPTTVTFRKSESQIAKDLGLPVADAIDEYGTVMVRVVLDQQMLNYKLEMMRPDEKYGFEIELTVFTEEERKEAFDFLASKFNLVIDWDVMGL